MSISQDLYTFLVGKTAFTDIFDTRCYPLRLPRGVQLPAVVCQYGGTEELQTHDGHAGLSITSVQVTVFAKTYDEAKNGEEVIRALVHKYGRWPWSSAQSLVWEGSQELHEDSPETWYIVCSITVWHE